MKTANIKLSKTGFFKVGIHTPVNSTRVFRKLENIGLKVNDFSWHNDAADRFEINGTNVSIWMKNDNETIYSYAIEIENSEKDSEFIDFKTRKQLLDFLASDVFKLAREFSAQLLADIGAENLKKVLQANDKEKDKTVCASGEYCDSNITMLEAFSKLFSREVELDGETKQGEKDMELWNKAWDTAKQFRFFYPNPK